MIKKNIVYGAGYHSRNAYRSLYKKKNIIYFFDINKFGKKIFGKNILYPSKGLVNTKIIFAGLSEKTINLIIKKFNWKKNNIVILKKKDIQPNKKNLHVREKKTLDILRKIVKYFNQSNCYYFMNFSSLLTYIRKDNFSFYSDVDISLEEKDFNKFKKELLLNKLITKRMITIKKNKISIIYGKIDNINYEPPNIDISKFKIKKNKVFLFRENINKVSKVNIKFLRDLQTIKYKNMKLKVPKKIEFYLSKIYGKGYKKKTN